MPRDGEETAVEWLTRIGDTRAVGDYGDFMAILHANGSKERRALWDLLAGIRGLHYDGNDRPWSRLVRFGRVFLFPVYREACKYRGVEIVRNAWPASHKPHAHRKPQVTKFGPRLKKLIKS